MSQERYFAIFQQAQKNLEKNPQSEQDQFVVDLWNASKNLYDKNENLKQALESAQSDARHKAAQIDLLETKLVQAQKQGVQPMGSVTFESFMSPILAGASEAS